MRRRFDATISDRREAAVPCPEALLQRLGSSLLTSGPALTPPMFGEVYPCGLGRKVRSTNYYPFRRQAQIAAGVRQL